MSGADGSEIVSGFPFGVGFPGGVRVAYGDLTGDGIPDPIVAMGQGGGLVRLFDGATLTNFRSGAPFGTSFGGGVFVAAGDVNGDGRADVIVAPGRDGGEVRVYNAADGNLLTSGNPFPGYARGVHVAAGDVNHDGFADVIAAKASGDEVAVFSGADRSRLLGGSPYGMGFGGGVFVAAGDVNADNHYDVIVAPGTGNGPVYVVDGRTHAVLGSFEAYPSGFTGGVRVAAADLTGDGRADIITAPGPGGQPVLRVFDGATFTLVAEALAYDAGFTGGVFVATPASSGRLRFTSASTTTFTIGEAESFTVTTAGAPPATSVTQTGSLPDGVTFTDNGDGTATLAGTPAAGSGGTYPLTFTAANGAGPNETQSFTLEVVDAAPRVTATTPADGATAVPIDAPLSVTFSEPVNVTATAFSLQCPPGTPVAITVPTASPASQFTIDPTVDLPATTACTLRVVADQVADVDADDPPDTLEADFMASFTTSACAAITVSPTTLAGGNLNVAYGPVPFTQVGGAAPITWNVSSGTLPQGLMLAASTGVLSGTPTATGPFAFTVTATAVSGCTGSAALTLNIAAGPNQAPSFAVGPDQTVNEDGGAQNATPWATAISPGPADEASQTVTFNVTGNTNPALFSVPPAVSPSGTLTYMPAANVNGTATITIVLQDNGGTALGGVDTSAPQSFTITVDAVNDAPSFTIGADQTVTENSGPHTVGGWATALSAGPADEAAQTLTFAVTNNTNAALFSAGPAVSSTGQLTYTTATNASGTATITLVLTDSGGTALGGVDTSVPQTFTVTVNGVNSAPSFTKGADQIVAEDSGAQIVNPWATAISPGPPDEAGQVLTFNVTGNTNPALFSAAPAVSATGVLTYTPAANASGTATITLTLSDDGGTAGGGVDTSAPQSFTITVTGLNDAPSFVAGAGPTSAEDAGAQSVNPWATAISPGPPSEAAQTVTFIVTGNTNPALFSAGPAVSPTGILTYTSAPNAFGSSDITLVLQDNGGTVGGGVDTSAPQSFTITVTPVNDAPAVANETFDILGNTELRVDFAGGTTPHTVEATTGVSAVQGVLDNDSDPENDPFTVTAITGCADVSAPFDCTLPSGAVVHVEADGAFSVIPAPAATTAGFTYTATDTPAVGVAASTNGTVTFTVFDMIWYVDGTVAGPGTGTSADPFNSFTATNLNGVGGAGDLDNLDDYIFVYDSTITGGIVLEEGEHLIGEFAGLSLNRNLNGNGAPTNLVAAGGSRTVLTSAGNAITMSNAVPAEVRGFALTSTAGDAINLTTNGVLAGASTLTITNNEISAASAEGIDVALNAGTTGTLALLVQGNTWNAANTHGGNGVSINHAAGAGTLNVDISGNTNIKTNGVGIIVNGGAVTSTNVTGFAGNAIHGDSLGGGVTVTNATFDAVPGGGVNPVNGGALTIGVDGNGIGGTALTITGAQGNLSFSQVQAHGATGLNLSGAGSGLTFGVTPLSSGGNSAVKTTSGLAVLTNTVALDLQLAELVSSGAAAGVSLTATSGALSAPVGSSITKASGAGTAFSVASSSAIVSYAGTLNVTSGSGVSLTGNAGSTMSFTGGVTLSTGANAAFVATGGGTVIVTDPAGPAANTIATTTGTALNVANTTIGAGGLVFQSIAANGATNGIVLNATGATAGLTVAGTGANDSGGVIQNSTGDAIQLTNTRNISLSEMRLASSGQSQIDATTVTNLSLNGVDTDSSSDHGIKGNGITNLAINGGTFNRGGANAEPTCNINGVNITNLFGTSSVTGATFTRSNTIQFRVQNLGTSGSLDTLMVSGTNWNTHNGPCHGDHLSVDANNGSNFKLVTTAASGENNFQGAGIGVQATAGGNGTMEASITGVQTSGNTAGVVVAATGTSNLGFNVFDNTTANGTGFSGTGSLALAMTCTTTGTCQGAFTNNSIAHTAGTGTNAMQVVVEGNGTGIVTIANNTINGNIQRGIHAQQGAGTGTGSLSLHVTGNNITGTDAAGLQGVNVATSLSGDAGIVNTMCLNLANNTVSPNPFVGAQAYRLVSDAGDVFRLQNFTGDGSQLADIQTWVTTTKSNVGTPIGATIGAAFTTSAGCAAPTLPTP